MKQKVSLFLLSGFYILAGANHFLNPGFYYGLIPDYFIFIVEFNALAGAAEIVLGILLLFSATRKFAAFSIMLMLLIFITSHVFFIEQGSCTDALCVPDWIGWARLVVVHPLLIWWAYSVRNA